MFHLYIDVTGTNKFVEMVFNVRLYWVKIILYYFVIGIYYLLFKVFYYLKNK